MIQTIRYRCTCGALVEQGKRCRCTQKEQRTGHRALYKRRAWRGSDDTSRDDGLRGRFLAQHPLCVECLEEGRTTPAVDVDHIQPHRGNPDLFWDWDNLAPLCKQHHGAKSGGEK